MERPLEGIVLDVPFSDKNSGGTEYTIFRLKVDKSKLEEGLVMPTEIGVTIQEKVRIDKGEKIRGYYNSNTSGMFFHRYVILNEDGEPTYENVVSKI